MATTANKIAVNTIIMYVRMLFLMVIAFYSSRLLLQVLGVEDFGIQSVVGSISSTFVSLKALFSESVQRYLNYEKGINSLAGQRSVFTLGIIIHIFLAIIFILIVETVGTWLINNKLDIPTDKLEVAFFVFQMTIISVTISIFSIPYDAVIIANEKMSTYAFVSVIDALLKLGAVLVISWVGCNKLKLYSALLLVVPIFTLSFQVIYCRKFPECRFTNNYNKSLFKDLFSLSGWNFLGNITFSLVHEGVNMLLNMFGGLVFNASRSIAYQVKVAASQITSNTIISARPKIMQQSAIENTSKVFSNIIAISRIAFFTILLPVSMILAYTEQLLSIWLVEVPEDTALFTRLLLLSIVVRSLHDPLNIMYMSYARIKRMMIVEAVTMLAFLTIIYISLRGGAPIWCPFVEIVFMETFIVGGLIINARYELNFPITDYIKNVIIPFLSCGLLIFFICFIFNNLFPAYRTIDTLIKCSIVGIIYSGIACMFLNKQEINIIQNLIFKFIKKKKNGENIYQ